MADPLLLDTCAIIWVANDEPIAKEAREAICSRAPGRPAGLRFADLRLGARNAGRARRISLRMSPEKWFDRLLGAPGIRLAELPPSVLIASSYPAGRNAARPG